MQTTHMATPVLEVAHLEKIYGALGNVTRALNDVSFTDVAQLRLDHR